MNQDIVFELDAIHFREGGRLALDLTYDLRRRYPLAAVSDFVEEARVRLTVSDHGEERRPQDLTRGLLSWLEGSYHTRLARAKISWRGSTVKKDWAAIRRAAQPDLAELSLTTHARRKGDPFIEVD